MTTEPEHAALTAELAELRRNIDVGLARVDGQLALLAHQEEEAEEDLSQLTGRVRILERGRWPLPSVAALSGVGAMAVAVWQASGR